MKYIKSFENKINSEKFKEWFKDSKIVDNNGNPLIVYHGTNKIFRKFSSNHSAMGGIIWFTNNKEKIEKGEVGAAGSGIIKELYISMKNPAGWDEYEKYTLGQLQNLGYDGCILPHDENTFDGFVFNSNQIRIKN